MNIGEVLTFILTIYEQIEHPNQSKIKPIKKPILLERKDLLQLLKISRNHFRLSTASMHHLEIENPVTHNKAVSLANSKQLYSHSTTSAHTTKFQFKSPVNLNNIFIICIPNGDEQADMYQLFGNIFPLPPPPSANWRCHSVVTKNFIHFLTFLSTFYADLKRKCAFLFEKHLCETRNTTNLKFLNYQTLTLNDTW